VEVGIEVSRKEAVQQENYCSVKEGKVTCYSHSFYFPDVVAAADPLTMRWQTASQRASLVSDAVVVADGFVVFYWGCLVMEEKKRTS